MDHLPGTATIHQTSPQARVIASGDFDITTTPQLAAQLEAAIAEGCREFRLDLDAVTFCDAAIVGVLLAVERRLRAGDGTLSIVAASVCVRRLLQVVDLRRLLDPALGPV